MVGWSLGRVGRSPPLLSRSGTERSRTGFAATAISVEPSLAMRGNMGKRLDGKEGPDDRDGCTFRR